MTDRVETDNQGTGFRIVERKQTGCCEQAQSDGIPCPHPRCDCESCAHSRLDGSKPALPTQD